MNYLITGGAGFIGSHLADALTAQGNRVTIIDDLSTGSMRNIAQLRTQKHFHYVVGTVLNRPLLAELVDEADAVFHLAAAVGVKLIVESPVRTIETNVRCTKLLLDVAAKKKKRVLVASTSEVYGKSTDLPYEESFEDMPRRVPATQKINTAIGWKPELGLDEILRSVIEYVRESQPKSGMHRPADAAV